MDRLGLIIWAVAAPVLMGIFVLVVLVVPSLAEQDKQLILPAAVAGAVLAAPVAFVVAKQLKKLTQK
ncbi:MAG: hypothetical protein KDI46_09050 [Alphaproteobacteria bacterium]|nr:hypothetical protein [Alphaproteobacteria bacterium]